MEIQQQIDDLSLAIESLKLERNQSQRHGFIFENIIRSNVFNINQEANSTAVHDIPCHQNIFNSQENISIKTTQSNVICCGSILNFLNYDMSEKHTMLIVKYKQVGSNKKIVQIFEFDYSSKCRAMLLGNLPLQEIEKYVDNVRSIPTKLSGKEAKAKFDYLTEKNKLSKFHGLGFRINPKVSTSQSRVQCSINNFEKTLNEFITYKSPIDQPNMIRGKKIDLEIDSKCRVRKNKTKY